MLIIIIIINDGKEWKRGRERERERESSKILKQYKAVKERW